MLELAKTLLYVVYHDILRTHVSCVYVVSLASRMASASDGPFDVTRRYRQRMELCSTFGQHHHRNHPCRHNHHQQQQQHQPYQHQHHQVQQQRHVGKVSTANCRSQHTRLCWSTWVDTKVVAAARNRNFLAPVWESATSSLM